MLLSKDIKTIIKNCCWIILCVCSATICSCSKDDGDDSVDHYDKVVVVYMAAENTLSNYVLPDVTEMLNAKSSIAKGQKLILFVDDTSLPRIYVIDRKTSATNLRALTPAYTYSSELNSASPSTVDEVMQWVYNKYPATTYGLILWSHGGGWINQTSTTSSVSERKVGAKKTFAVDNQINSGSSNRGIEMNVPELATVLNKYSGIEFVMFDACQMQTMEVAYELKDCAKYIIGSPAEIPVNGAPYSLILPKIYSSTFSADSIAYTYYDHYYNEGINYGGCLISTIKTDEFPGFVSTMQKIFAEHEFLNADYSSCLNYYLADYWNYLDGVFDKLPDAYDIMGIMKTVLTQQEFDEWKKAYDKLVTSYYATDYWQSDYQKAYMRVNHNQFGGVSMYLPLEKYKDEDYYNDYYNFKWAKLFNIK